jgi:transcriptional regulator with XRE-family HTH domain
MEFTQNVSDRAAIEELGNRLSRYRLNRNQSQEALAGEAGVSLRTIIRIEQGECVQLTSMIRVLRALGLLGNLDALVPAPPVSPIQQAKMRGKRRQRASSPSDKTDRKEPWSWGDEE